MPPIVLLYITPQTVSYGLQGAEQTQHDNCLAYDPEHVRVLSFGKHEARLKNEMGKDWPAFRHKVAFTSIFDPHARGPVFDFQILAAIMEDLRQQAFRGRFLGSANWPWKMLDMRVEIQDYEAFFLGRQREFEYYLQDFHHARHLWVNGKDCTIPASRRSLQAGVGAVLRILLPALVLYGGLALSVDYWGKQMVLAAGIVAAGAALALLAYLLGTALYLWLFRRCLPHGYLRYQLRGRITWLRKLSRWLAERMLD
ncbi:MAG TPA: hypothetical protein PKM21_14105 [Anaerolineales bacterium]|nr:hypothetical protein [Anaerolineales bacterium]